MEHDEINQRLGEITQWQRAHEEADNKRFTAIEETLAEIPKRGELEEVVSGAMKEALFSAGRTAKGTLLTVAMVIGALAVIGGGFKWILGLVGFEYITK